MEGGGGRCPRLTRINASGGKDLAEALTRRSFLNIARSRRRLMSSPVRGSYLSRAYSNRDSNAGGRENGPSCEMAVPSGSSEWCQDRAMGHCRDFCGSRPVRGRRVQAGKKSMEPVDWPNRFCGAGENGAVDYGEVAWGELDAEEYRTGHGLEPTSSSGSGLKKRYV